MFFVFDLETRALFNETRQDGNGAMEQDLLAFMKMTGKDPSRLIFEDELTSLNNRRFLGHYFEHKVDWERTCARPVSLLMLDLDHFKQINDTHGHQAGDEALVFVAELIRRAAAETGIPIRYAGDEFMVLLPESGKDDALALGQRLVQAARDNSCHISDPDVSLRITFSVGVASAPDDAVSGKELVARADSALYLAKRTGRDRVADAAQVDPETTAAKNALAAANRSPTAGRKAQLAQVVGHLKKFMQKESQFLLVEGAPGTGKTAFLDMVDQTLARTRIPRVRVAAMAQELFRPYCVAADIVLALMDRKPDKGVAALKGLAGAERDALACVLPQLAGCDRKWEDEEDDSRNREMIFTTLFKFIPALIDRGPLVLFVDDMHLADEASLMLLRLFIQKKAFPVFVCASATDTGSAAVIPDDDSIPLERFRYSHGSELGIHKVRLTPLSDDDVAAHLSQAFPEAMFPNDFVRELARASQGNPLFLSEILKNLVADKKIRAAGKGWAVETLEEGYLPRSLEEIISRKVTSLDEESKRILATVSAYGDNVSMSLLSGSANEMEAQVQDFLEQAVSQGLVSVDFNYNDENVRFLSSRVAELIYGGMGDDPREKIHERIGSYQESLHKEGLLPSAAILAYHFQRSANIEKAKLYEALQSRHNTVVFNASEAAFYSGDGPPDAVPDEPLDAEGTSLVADLMRSFLIAIRNTKLYPAGSQLTRNAVAKLKSVLDAILLTNSQIHLAHEKKVLYINGVEADVSDYKGTADSFVTFLGRLELAGLIFKQGISEDELFKMLDAAGRVDRKMIRDKFWVEFAAEQGLARILLRQVRYAEMREGPAVPSEEEARELAATLSEESELSYDDLVYAASVVRNFLGAAAKMRLYPPEGPVAAIAIEQVMDSLKNFFERQPYLTLARVGSAFLANGSRVEHPEFEKLTPALLRYLETSGIKSITFLPKSTTSDFVAFFRTAANRPQESVDAAFWTGSAREQGISGILFDQAVYGILESQKKQAGLPEDEESPHDGPPIMTRKDEGEPEAGNAAQKKRDPVEEAPELVRDLFLKGEAEEASMVLENLFSIYAGGDNAKKIAVIQAVKSLAEAPDLGSQAPFLKMLAEPALSAFSTETGAEALSRLVPVLVGLASSMVELSDYNLATWVLGKLNQRRDSLYESDSEADYDLADRIVILLPPQTEKLLVTDAASSNPERRQAALSIMGGLGPAAVPLLLGVIKESDDPRTRQVAASAISKAGDEAVGLFKAELATDSDPAHRSSMLTVADLIDRDLGSEIAIALGDGSPKVRHAAFGLAERLGGVEISTLLMSYVDNSDVPLAEGAIRTLGRICSRNAAPALIEVVRTAKEPRTTTAACTALGCLCAKDAVAPLARLLKPRGFLWFKKEQPAAVRGAAALALASIADPAGLEVLAALADDPEPRVREAVKRAFPVKPAEK